MTKQEMTDFFNKREKAHEMINHDIENLTKEKDNKIFQRNKLVNDCTKEVLKSFHEGFKKLLDDHDVKLSDRSYDENSIILFSERFVCGIVYDYHEIIKKESENE